MRSGSPHRRNAARSFLILLICAIGSATQPATKRAASPRDLSFPERVAAQEAIEGAYYSAPSDLSPSFAGPNATGAAGPEFQVSDSFPPRYHLVRPGAGMTDSGDFLVVWATAVRGGLSDMAARAFDESGTPRGDDFILGLGNIFGYFPEDPDVSAGDTQFVVAWTSHDGSSFYKVTAQRLDLQGELVGPPVIDVHSYGGYNAEVATEPGGDFIVVWYPHNLRVNMRRFESTGAPAWPEQSFVVGSSAPPDPDVTVDALGDFTVVWSRSATSGPTGIQGKKFGSSGAPLGGTFPVSESTTGGGAPAIASSPDGGFIVVWQGPDANLSGVFGRIFDASAQPLGPEFQVNTTTSGSQQYPDVSADDRGNFMVAWHSGPNTQRADVIMARRFDPMGTPLGDDFKVNVDFSTGQQRPVVAMRGDGESFVAWYSNSPDSIRARRFCAIPNVSAPGNLAVCEGGSGTFSVAASGRQPFSHQWRKDGAPLQDNGRISGSSSPLLAISGVTMEDAGSYECMVVDACADPQALLSLPAQLAIAPPASEVTGLALQTENEGATLRFAWATASGASDYVVRRDVAPNGSFPDVVGYATDPGTGLTVPMTPDTEFFLVAARNPICGEGPLR